MLQKLIPNVLQMKGEFVQATWETLYMTFGSAIIAAVLGLLLGVCLVITQPGGILEDGLTYSVLDKITNLLRSIPFIILLAVISPLTQFLIGTTVGTTASLVPLIVGIFPFYARQVQNALLDVDHGVIEAAQSMGSSPTEIIFRSISGKAGRHSAGVYRDCYQSYWVDHHGRCHWFWRSRGRCISIGYARFENDVTFVAMIIILILVFAVQIIGDLIVKAVEHNE